MLDFLNYKNQKNIKVKKDNIQFKTFAVIIVLIINDKLHIYIHLC